jgi:tetratricopeptide (TPR) repeat protein
MRLASKLLAACMFALLACATARADWLEASTENFVIYSDGSEASLREFTTKVEQFDQVLRIITGIKPEHFGPRLKIYIARNERDVRELMSREMRNVAGFYTTSLRGAVAVINRSKPSSQFGISGEEVLFHEYAHHFMLQHAAVVYPAWYVEGFAEYVAGADFDKKDRIVVGKAPPNRVWSLVQEPWIKSARLFGPMSDLSERERLMLYAQGWLLTHYLFHDNRRSDQFGKFLQAMAKGESQIPAFERDLGMTLPELDKELRRYFEKLKRSKISMPTIDTSVLLVPPISIRALDAAESAGLELSIVIRDSLPPEKQTELIAKAEEYASKYANRPQALLLSAEAYFACERYAEAKALALRGLALDPSMQRAQVVAAAADMYALARDDKLTAEAAKPFRTSFVKANRANPNDPLALYYFYQSFSLAGQKPSPNAADGLAAVLSLVPQDSNVRLMLGYYLAKTNEPAKARNVLAPLAFAPHGGGASKSAQDLLAELPQIPTPASVTLTPPSPTPGTQ